MAKGKHERKPGDKPAAKKPAVKKAPAKKPAAKPVKAKAAAVPAKKKPAKKRVRKSPVRLLMFAAALLAVIALIYGVRSCNRSMNTDAPAPMATATPVPTAEPTPAPTPQPTPKVETVKFSASGDNLIHKPIYVQAERRAQENGSDAKYDFAYAYQNMADFYKQFDVNWINQESLVNDVIPAATYPCFSTPGECAKALYDIGFRVFSLANNHSYDQGMKGIAATMDFWNSMPDDVYTTGLWKNEDDQMNNIPVQEVNGIKIAYLAYTEHTNGISIGADKDPAGRVIYTSDADTIRAQIVAARKVADVVVVGTHWGVEYSNEANEAQKELAQRLADWGADLIIGTHPHVLQDAEWLTAADGRQVFVAYSLGNFISTQNRTPRVVGGILTVDLTKITDVDGSVAIRLNDPKIHPVITHYEAGRGNVRCYLYRDYTPELAAEHGMRAYDSSFSYDALRQIAQEAVSEEFLDLN